MLTLIELALNLFYLPSGVKLTSFAKKAMTDYAIARAGCEIHVSFKDKTQGLGNSMNEKFKSHSALIIAELNHKPGFGWVTEEIFDTVDIKGRNKRVFDDENGMRLWTRYKKVIKLGVTNYQNDAIQKAKRHFPGGVIPSGKDVASSFWPLLLKYLYLVEEDAKRPPSKKASATGGSAAKAATKSPVLPEGVDDEDEVAEEEDEDEGDGEAAHGEAAADEDGSYGLFDNSPSKNTRGKKRDACEGPPNPPTHFIPSNILVLVHLGELSSDCRPPFKFAVPARSDDATCEGASRAVLRKQAAQMSATTKTADKDNAPCAKEGSVSKMKLPSAPTLAERKVVIAERLVETRQVEARQGALTTVVLILQTKLEAMQSEAKMHFDLSTSEYTPHAERGDHNHKARHILAEIEKTRRELDDIQKSQENAQGPRSSPQPQTPNESTNTGIHLTYDSI